MAKAPLCVMQVNARDAGGGAEAAARNLYLACRRRGLSAWLAAGQKLTDDEGVLPIPNGDEFKFRDRYRKWLAGEYPPPEGGEPAGRSVRWMTYPLHDALRRLLRLAAKQRGRDDANFPGSRRLLELPPQRPDVVHLHNLHGGFFDLAALPQLSRQVATFLTLHDGWTFSGHCAHSLGCDRWRTGCGSCPDLSIYPPVKRDSTAANWRDKRSIFLRARLYLSAPSKWLLDRAADSILAPAAIESRVIPNGVDRAIFHPGDRTAARLRLGLQPDADILLFAANGIRSNCFKDYDTLRKAIELVGCRGEGRRVLLLALGEEGPPETLGRCEIRFVPPIREAGQMAEYYRAADLYLHAAKADTFPTTVIEALSCGVPVVASEVGGIPEQVRSLNLASAGVSVDAATSCADSATGALAPAGDAVGMATAVLALLADPPLLRRLSANAARDAANRFSLERHVDAWLDWYQEVAAGAIRKAA